MRSPPLREDEVRLYGYWRSSTSYRVRIALNLKGIAFQDVPVDLLAGAHRAPGHMARHPQGRVPVLEIDGRSLVQSLAILEYLEETRPAPPLLPPDAIGRARVRALAHAIASDVAAPSNLGIADAAAGLANGGADERARAKAQWMHDTIADGLAGVEGLLARGRPAGPLCHGTAPTLADVCLVPQVYNARRWDVDLQATPAVRDAALAAETLEAFALAHPDRFSPTRTAA